MLKKINENKHVLLLLYFPIYMIAFSYLEKRVTDKIHIIDCSLDQYIPFLEIFVVPYLLWFLYIAVTGFYFLFREKESFCRLMYFGMIGMTLFLVVSFLYPNGLELRPETFPRDNIFTDMTKFVYAMDTPTNVCPSIHVFNSMGVLFGVRNSEKLKNRKWIQNGATISTALIILSTMFLKQHSVVDVLMAMVLSYLSYDLVYNGRWNHIFQSFEEVRHKFAGNYTGFGRPGKRIGKQNR